MYMVVFENGEKWIVSSAEELANLCNVSQQTCSLWATGKSTSYTRHGIVTIYRMKSYQVV